MNTCIATIAWEPDEIFGKGGGASPKKFPPHDPYKLKKNMVKKAPHKEKNNMDYFFPMGRGERLPLPTTLRAHKLYCMYNNYGITEKLLVILLYNQEWTIIFSITMILGSIDIAKKCMPKGYIPKGCIPKECIP